MIKENKIGNIFYLYSNRVNNGTIRDNENVLWSFAPHDISIFQYFIQTFPQKVISNGSSHININIYDSVLTSIQYPNNIKGHIFNSWIHPFKEHRLVVIGSKGSLSFTDSKVGKPLLLFKNNFLKKQHHHLKN